LKYFTKIALAARQYKSIKSYATAFLIKREKYTPRQAVDEVARFLETDFPGYIKRGWRNYQLKFKKEIMKERQAKLF